MWPSVHDRGVYKLHLEQLSKMAAGDLEQLRIQSTYLHGQGLMVLVSGELQLVRGRGRRAEPPAARHRRARPRELSVSR
jgi:hypothetical protein